VGGGGRGVDREGKPSLAEFLEIRQSVRDRAVRL
jgi:hypothetical protein